MRKEAIKKVIRQPFEDQNFYGQLFQENSQIPKGYDLKPEEWMRIRTAYVRCTETYVNEKFDSQLVEKVLTPILSRQVW